MSDHRAEAVDFGKYHGSLEMRISVNADVRHFTIPHLSQLTIPA